MATILILAGLTYLVIMLVLVDHIRYHARKAATSAKETERLLRELHAIWTQPPSV